MMSGKRRTHLTIAEKYDAILMKESNEPVADILEKYGIARSTFQLIYARREEIKKRFENSTVGFSCSAKRVLRGSYPVVDKVLLHWYLRCKERNVQMTGADIRRKAVEINKEIKGHSSFKASYAWFQGFKERYRITNADIREDLPTANKFDIGEAFTVDFNKLLEEYGFTLKNVYNVVYTAIMWKSVPKNTVILDRAKSTGNLKMCEDYVTALFCANATGCHKLPVLIIGNVPENQRLYNFKTEAFSTIYRSKSNVCMDSVIFTQWYKEHFLESVKERQERENGRRERSLLLLDNATLLHDIDDLNKIDPFVIVMSPPPDVPRIRHPMNCGIIRCFIRKYRKELVETIKPLPPHYTEDEVIYLHKELSMWDCCRIVHDAWSYVDDAILIHSWDSLLQRKIMDSREYAKIFNADVLETVQSLQDLPGCETCEEDDVLSWFHIDNEYDIVDKKCTQEVLEEFRNNCLGQPLDIDIIDDQAGPSYA